MGLSLYILLKFVTVANKRASFTAVEGEVHYGGIPAAEAAKKYVSHSINFGSPFHQLQFLTVPWDN